MKLIKLSTLVLFATSFIACDKGSESSFSENLSTTTVLETINSLSFKSLSDTNRREMNIYGIIISLFF